MHYMAILVTPPGVEPTEETIATMMAPFDENRRVAPVVKDDETYWTNPMALWDWYQVGGRWTGVWSDYDPRTDPDNVETCALCGGTGTRPDMVVKDGCNGCGGKGAAVKWPTEWVDCPADIARWGDVRESVIENPPYAVVGSELFAKRERYNPEGRFPDWEAGETNDDIPNEERKFVQTNDVATALEPITDDCTVVVIDCHI